MANVKDIIKAGKERAAEKMKILAEQKKAAKLRASETHYGPNTDMGPAKSLDPE